MKYLAILVALGLSSIAAWFSILGLTAIFPASRVSVLAMAGSLEVAKIVTVVWLHLHWEKLTFFIKSYLTLAVIVLMVITSIGVFGFLSRAHIETQLRIDTGVGQEIASVSQQIDALKNTSKTLDNDISAIDDEYKKLLDVSKKNSEVRRAIREKAKGRDQLVEKRNSLNNEMLSLEQSKIELEGKKKLQEVELGPIKYITLLFNDRADVATMEKVVTYLIIILVLVFDPLAIMLLLGVSNIHKNRNKLMIDKSKRIVNDKDIFNL